MSKMERAIAVATEFEFRETSGGGREFEGYAIVWDTDSEPMPYIESVAPGAAKRSLKGSEHTFVIDHDDSKLLASTQAKTLTLREDSKGLIAHAPELPKTSYANDLIELAGLKEIRHMSFEFGVPRAAGSEEWSDDLSRRRLNTINLGHVTVLTGKQPAYTQTTAFIRSLANTLHTEFDELADAFAALREGRKLTASMVELIEQSIAELREIPPPDPEPEAPTSIEALRAQLEQKRELAVTRQ